ncbi:MAG: PUR family DNA/RNA-binding protein [Crocinitomicaceae bacterium]|nr:PUR family DNA/RNA-binding protein [Crocinitomicaceae bacterium]
MMENESGGEVFSKAVRAGKRTYFFDVKTTKGNDLYLTVTESKKVQNQGRESYQKHKIFLYKEDFEKFKEGLIEALDKIEELKDDYPMMQNSSSDLDFDDL